jgi:hypothetical protein
MSSSHSGPGDPRRRIGARVRVLHLLDQAGRREELEGVVVGCQRYGVNVRLADGTIREFSDVEVSCAKPARAELTPENHLRLN